VLHEWLGLETAPVVPDGVGGDFDARPATPHTRGGGAPAFGRVPLSVHERWSPPLLLLAHLARRGLDQPVEGDAASSAPKGWVVWIGRHVWPYPRTLIRRESRGSPRGPDPDDADAVLGEGVRGEAGVAESRSGGAPALGAREAPRVDHALLSRSVFVDPPDAGARVWAIDAALRCPSVAVVVADGSGLRLSASRRLQLAAESGRALALLARPPWERVVLSAAATRWLVQRAPPSVSEAARPAWTLRLLRARGGGGAGAATAFADPDAGTDIGADTGNRRAYHQDQWACNVEWVHALGLLESPVLPRGESRATRSA